MSDDYNDSDDVANIAGVADEQVSDETSVFGSMGGESAEIDKMMEAVGGSGDEDGIHELGGPNNAVRDDTEENLE